MVDAVNDLRAAARHQTAAATPAIPAVNRKPIRLPIQVAAALGVIVLLAIVVGLLSWQTYRSSQAALIAASEDTVRYIREAVSEQAKRILEPANAQLDFLSHSHLSEATTQPDRLREVPLITEALHNNKVLDAIYVGYPNGEFVLFRGLESEASRRSLNAPDNAAIGVQSMTLGGDGAMLGEYRFYDKNNMLIASRVEPNYHYDPRTRPWYKMAIDQAGTVLTDAYVFFTNRSIGITLARQSADGGAIVGLDLKLSSVAQQVSQLKITPSAEIALVNSHKQVTGYKDATKMVVQEANGSLRLADIADLGSAPLLAAADFAFANGSPTRTRASVDGQRWELIQAPIDITETRQARLLIAIPDREFFAAARALVWEQLEIAGIILLLAIGAAWFLTRLLVTPLERLTGETRRIESLDFSSPVRVASWLGEIDDLGRALHGMKRTIQEFLNIGAALATEREFKPLAERVLIETIELVGSDGGAIYMLDDDQKSLKPEIVRWTKDAAAQEAMQATPIPLDRPGLFSRFAAAVKTGQIVVADNMLGPDEAAALALPGLTAGGAPPRMAFVVVPLLDNKDITFGLLVLARTGSQGWTVDERLIQLIHAVSGSASVAIQNKLLLDAQRDLISSLIKLIAGAIDAKSPYTAGHCQRVPVLTRMLADAAVKQTNGPFRDFRLSDEEWEAVDVASWLHDCGKVTTPEFVVDKATKLETIYDRIHEIRMRFEVLKRDAEIDYWHGVADGGDEAALRAEMEKAKAALDDDFAFIARCNEGSEFMAQADLDRINAVASRFWTRTISNRLGLSYEEHERFSREPEPQLPVEEPLLANRQDHLIELPERILVDTESADGFALTQPTVKYNRGEVYNLSVSRGTLTEEERFQINDHIVQTLVMLENLPFPKHLRDVPELAGGHHEKMDGTGYPRGRRGEDMSLVARMMAIADVFEALTAADRPYKKAKPLSEAIRIMGIMKRNHHLDPDLLDLFLTAEVWREYAKHFLDPEQIDEPDIEAVLKIEPA